MTNNNEAKLNVKLLNFTPSPEATVAMAAKLCYSNADIAELQEKIANSDVEKFVTMLTEMNHHSAIEHISFTFGVEGVSRVLTHQLVRHRISSFSQKSQRYVKEGQFEYIIPEPMKVSPKAVEIFIKHMKEDQRTYDELVNILEEEFLSEAVKNIVNKPNSHTPNPIKHILIGFLEDDNIEEVVKKDLKKILSTCEKKAIENARYVLPNACETKIVLTMNARSLLHFFNLRCCSRAQDEIRNLAIAMLKECKAVAPSIFKNAGPSCVSSPCPEGNMSCGKFFEMRKFFQSL